MRRVPFALVLALVALAGCGSSTTTTSTSAPGTTTSSAAAARLTGTTSQGRPVTVANRPAGVVVELGLQLTCKDGSSTSTTVLNTAHPVPLGAGGTFYVQESGTTPASTFQGYGAGEYRWAASGRIQGATAQGKVAFRIHFKETKCVAQGVTWQAHG